MPRPRGVTFVDQLMQARSVAPARTGKVGRNVRLQEGWRDRLLKHLPADVSYRLIAERALIAPGRSLSHTTVRAALLGSGTITLDTLAAICDALGVDIAQVITGNADVRTMAPASVALPAGLSITVLPIVDIADAARWSEVAADSDKKTEMYFIESANAEGLMVARITDDSMAPEYLQGDLVTFRIGAPPSPKVPAIVQVEPHREAMMRIMEETDERVKLQALNEDYGSATVSAKKISFLAHVVGHTRETLLTNP